MDRKSAEGLMRHMQIIDLAFGEISTILEQEEFDDEVRRNMRHCIATCILDLHEGVSLPVARKFPDLHPDI